MSNVIVNYCIGLHGRFLSFKINRFENAHKEVIFVYCHHTFLYKMCKKAENPERYLYICNKYDRMSTDKP